MGITTHPVQDHYNGERHVGHLRCEIEQATATPHAECLESDGAAVEHCLARPTLALKSIDASKR